MNFELHLTKSAERGLAKLRGLAEEAVREILALKQNPYWAIKGIYETKCSSLHVGLQNAC